jgi:hypothetical protein
MARASRDDLPVGVSEIFSHQGLDSGGRGATDLPVGQSIAFSSEVIPVRVKKTRQSKNPEPVFDPIKTGLALAVRPA